MMKSEKSRTKIIGFTLGTALLATLSWFYFTRTNENKAGVNQKIEKKVEKRKQFDAFKIQPEYLKTKRAKQTDAKVANPIDQIIVKIHQIFSEEKLNCRSVALGSIGSEERQQYLQDLFAQPTDQMIKMFGEIIQLADNYKPEEIERLVEDLSSLSSKRKTWTNATSSTNFGMKLNELTEAPDAKCMALHFEIDKFLDGAEGAANRAALKERQE